MTGKAFCVSIMMVMVETWMRKANSYPRICVYSTEHNSVPFSYGKDPVIKLPPGIWLITQKNNFISGVQC